METLKRFKLKINDETFRCVALINDWKYASPQARVLVRSEVDYIYYWVACYEYTNDEKLIIDCMNEAERYEECAYIECDYCLSYEQLQNIYNAELFE